VAIILPMPGILTVRCMGLLTRRSKMKRTYLELTGATQCESGDQAAMAAYQGFTPSLPSRAEAIANVSASAFDGDEQSP